MKTSWLVGWSLAVTLTACASEDFVDDPGDDTWLDGKADAASGVNIQATHLDVDLAAKTAVATIEPLMESLEHDLLPRDADAAAVFGVRLHRFEAAVERALRDMEIA
jgi:hypothetical protein